MSDESHWPLCGPAESRPIVSGPIEVFDDRFRDVSFGIMDLVDPENMTICLKYERREYSKLNLWCRVAYVANAEWH
jgi:hypothetical protein